MAKDKVNYRASRRRAVGSRAVEASIGVTQMVSCAACDAPAALEERPTGLLKWSFDDYTVEELLPEALLQPAPPAATHTRDATSLLVRVVSEGVPDAEVERVVRGRLPRDVSAHFLTPVDVAACTSRYVWVRGDGPTMRANFPGGRTTTTTAAAGVGAPAAERVRTASGDVWLDAGLVIAVPATSPSFPLAGLPSMRYTVVLRDVQASLGAVLPRLQSLATRGFLNYGHAARHGVGTLRAYQDGRCLLERDYVGFLQSYMRSLSEGTPHVSRELPAVLDALANPRAMVRDWRSAAAAIAAAAAEDRSTTGPWAQTGLYAPHHRQLVDVVRRAADVAPRHHDAAQVIREAVPRRVLCEKLRAVAEVHFNAHASLRWTSRPSVAVGDLVAAPGADAGDLAARIAALRDVYEPMADHIDGDMLSDAHQDWVALAQEESTQLRRELLASGTLRVVRTEAEAATYTPEQLLLPTLGRPPTALEDVFGEAAEKSGEVFHSLTRELHVGGLPLMRTAPAGGLRHLLCRPRNMGAYLVDEHRGWDWVLDSAGDGDTVAGVGTRLKAELYKDQEGITRVRSPVMALSGKNMIARRGVRGGGQRDGVDLARHHFLKPARRHSMTCVLRMELPRGSPITSALREAFQFTTLSTTGIYHLIARR